ncbi:hypothetical protein WEB32_11235 [Streptomyces netropsis]|uniref:hypothetical protein n=1 Tax=Streptomyces netropsis TaxID=55404 RepID=UPI0030CBC4D4
MTHRDTLDRLDRYRERLDALVGATSVTCDIDPRARADGRVLAVSYLGTPAPGWVTGFSYGLSLSRHPDWGRAARELTITVRSEDVEWSRVPARMVAALRGMCPFRPRQVLGHAEPYVEGSVMNSAVLGDPVIDGGSGLLDLSPSEGYSRENDLVEFVGVYPIHSSERDFVYSRGFNEFWSMEWDRVDPGREPVV